MTRSLLTVGSAALLCLVALEARAEEQGVHQHDGLYLRLTTGIGGSSTAETGDNDREVVISGGGGCTTLGLGYAIAPNFIINLDIFGNLIQDTTVKLNGDELGESSADLQSTNVGIGITYYIMPTNVYLGGAIGTSKMTVKTGDNESDTESGFGIDLIVGKEWWVSDNWGIGLAGQLFYTVVPDRNDNTGRTYDMKTTAIGLLFSATYN